MASRRKCVEVVIGPEEPTTQLEPCCTFFETELDQDIKKRFVGSTVWHNFRAGKMLSLSHFQAVGHTR